MPSAVTQCLSPKSAIAVRILSTPEKPVLSAGGHGTPDLPATTPLRDSHVRSRGHGRSRSLTALLFPRAAGANDHKTGDVTQQEFTVTRFWRPESDVKVSPGACVSGDSRGRFSPLPASYVAGSPRRPCRVAGPLLSPTVPSPYEDTRH